MLNPIVSPIPAMKRKAFHLRGDDLKDILVVLLVVLEGVGDILETEGVLFEGVDEGVELADASRFDLIADDEVADAKVGPVIARTPVVVFLLRRRLARLLPIRNGDRRNRYRIPMQ